MRFHASEADHGVITNEADELATGPESFVAIDPDGNAILVNPHFLADAPQQTPSTNHCAHTLKELTAKQALGM